MDTAVQEETDRDLLTIDLFLRLIHIIVIKNHVPVIEVVDANANEVGATDHPEILAVDVNVTEDMTETENAIAGETETEKVAAEEVEVETMSAACLLLTLLNGIDALCLCNSLLLGSELTS